MSFERVDRKSKKMLSSLMASILEDFNGEQSDYALEFLIPTLIPGLIQVMQLIDKKGLEDAKVQPINMLASFLYRQNPRHEQCSKRVRQHQGLIKDIIYEEKKRIKQFEFQAMLRVGSARVIADLNIWPVCAKTEEREPSVSLYGDAVADILDELESLAGIVGLKTEVQIALETLDVRNTGLCAWQDLTRVVTKWFELTEERKRAKCTVAFHRWLENQLDENLEFEILRSFQVSDIDGIYNQVLRPDEADMSVKTCLGIMYETRDDFLEWKKHDYQAFEPEDILDEQEMKCNDSTRLCCNDFNLVMSSFLHKLAIARMTNFYRV